MNSALFMTDLKQQNIVDKQKAELYMQLYPYIAQDFLSSADSKIYSDSINAHIQNIHKQLQRVMKVLANHTHATQPHSHAMQGSQPVVCRTLKPNQSSNIVWNEIKCPTVNNTTNCKWNIANNRAITGLPSEGMLQGTLRRALPLPLTLTTTLPPIYSAGIL